VPAEIANTVSEFVNIVSELDSSLIRTGMSCNEKLVFRGHSDIKYELVPQIGRNRKTAVDISMLNEERNLIEMAKFRLPNIFDNNLTPIELLALLQHHGIPTRLLDITENALVALYFACCSNNDKDGEVFAFKYNEQYIATYPIINAIADSYRFIQDTICPLDLFYEKVISQPYFLEQKRAHEICYLTSKTRANWIAECCKDLIFAYAPIRTLRQQTQCGRYILFPNQIVSNVYDEENTSYCFHKIIAPISKSHKDICGVITIPKEAKSRIIRELKLFGITKGALFPDSVDVVCEEIKKEFEEKVGGSSCANDRETF